MSIQHKRDTVLFLVVAPGSVVANTASAQLRTSFDQRHFDPVRSNLDDV